MIKNIRNLTKIDDILNSEGTILGLHEYKGNYCFSSHLKDRSGTVYYSVDAVTILGYFKNELRLREVFLASDDIVVPRDSGREVVYVIKEELVELISCGEKLFLENSVGIRIERIDGLLKNK